jgi:uncharacterized FlaG/YvyC family protein
MDITTVNRSSANPAATTAPAIPAEKAAENREVIQAVKALNGAELLGQDKQLVFQRDEQTRRIVIRVVNRQTNEVVSQIPPEYVLRLAEDLKNRA